MKQSFAALALAFTAMGCACEVQVHAAAPDRAAAALAAGLGEVRRLEAKFSRYRADSVVTRINASAGGAPVVLDDETAGLITYGATCWQASGGAFDLTSGVLRRAWDFRAGVLPSADVVAALLPWVGWDKVTWNPPRLSLPAGMEIDLGGIAKEYAADTAAAACLAAGATVALVNLGGDVRATGPHPDGRPWQIGIRHPRVPDGIAVQVALTQGGLATSGDYERFFEWDGRRYCHILDPRTGWPVTDPPPSVTVVAPVCLVAGSLTTLAMLAGTDAAAVLEAGGQPWLMLDAQGGATGPLTCGRLPAPTSCITSFKMT